MTTRDNDRSRQGKPNQWVEKTINKIVIAVQVDEETLNKHRRDGKELLNAAKRGDAAKAQRLIEQDAPVNYANARDRATALHYIAAYDARPALRVILKSKDLDYLVRDRDGRLPSELAREVGNDDAMARLLMIKEMRQAKARGVDPTSLYKISARKRAP
jgi:ankyrin repeat protein